MRKLIAFFSIAAVVAVPAALAKERNVQMFGAPVAPRVGQAFNATISVKIDGKLQPGKSPTVRLISALGRTLNVPSRATLRAGIYRARVVIPTAGTWRVIVVDRETGRAYEFARMKVRAV
jgi:hypothetical protein